jgi:hypothetical protein
LRFTSFALRRAQLPASVAVGCFFGGFFAALFLLTETRFGKRDKYRICEPAVLANLYVY